MLGRVGDRHAGAIRQHLDAPLALGKLLQEAKPMRVRYRLCHRGELIKQGLLGAFT
jgi:hypothetical protein